MIRLDIRSRNNVSSNFKDKHQQNPKSDNFQYQGRDGERKHSRYPNRSKGIQCREYERFGHIQVEYPNFLRKQGKGRMPPFQMISLMKEVNPTKQVVLWHLLLASWRFLILSYLVLTYLLMIIGI